MIRRLAMFAVLGLLATGCMPYLSNGRWSADTNNPRLLIMGDSIINSAHQELAATLDADGYWWRQFFAVPGGTVQEIDDGDDPFRTSAPDAVVVAAGTNDTGQCLNDPACWPDVPVERLDELWGGYAALGPATCRVGVTIVFDPGWRGAVNTRLYELEAQGVIDHVADWKAHSDGRAEWFADGVGHLTPAGQQAFTDFVVGEVDANCRD